MGEGGGSVLLIIKHAQVPLSSHRSCTLNTKSSSNHLITVQ